MIRLNFYFQSVILVLAILLGVALAIDFDESFGLFAYYQMFVGFVQVFVCVIMLLFRKLRTMHLAIYIGLTATFLALTGLVPAVVKPIFFTFPWALAVYFWYISFQADKYSH